MKRSATRFVVLLAVVLGVLMVTIAVSSASSTTISLKAGSSSCKVGQSVKFTATVSGSAYEVGIYKQSGSSWNKVATANEVSSGTYVAYVKARQKGTMKVKAGVINSSGTVTAWSKVVSIKVTS